MARKNPRDASDDLETRQAMMLHRHVLPMAEYIAELRRGNKHKQQTEQTAGSAPIPVPLLPHETEGEYEARFLQWLAKNNKKKRRVGDRKSDPNGSWERSVRITFARSEAKKFDISQK